MNDSPYSYSRRLLLVFILSSRTCIVDVMNESLNYSQNSVKNQSETFSERKVNDSTNDSMRIRNWNHSQDTTRMNQKQ